MHLTEIAIRTPNKGDQARRETSLTSLHVMIIPVTERGGAPSPQFATSRGASAGFHRQLLPAFVGLRVVSYHSMMAPHLTIFSTSFRARVKDGVRPG